MHGKGKRSHLVFQTGREYHAQLYFVDFWGYGRLSSWPQYALFSHGSYSATKSPHSFITERLSPISDTYNLLDKSDMLHFACTVQHTIYRFVLEYDDLFLIVGSLCTFCCYRNAWSWVSNGVVLLVSLWYPSVALPVCKTNTVWWKCMQRPLNQGVWEISPGKTDVSRRTAFLVGSRSLRMAHTTSYSSVCRCLQAFSWNCYVYKVMSIQGFTCTVIMAEETISGSWFATNFSREHQIAGSTVQKKKPKEGFPYVRFHVL